MNCPDKYVQTSVLGRRVRVHVLIAERALRRRLPLGAEVHHVDGSKSNNLSNNLVICQDKAYHLLLHARTRALLATGSADMRKCAICTEYDSPKALTFIRRLSGVKKGQEIAYHARCSANITATRRQRLKQ